MANIAVGNPKLQLYGTRNFAGMTEENHLKNAFLTQPAQMKSVISYMLSDTYYNRTGNSSVLPLLTDGIGTTEVVDNSEVRWDLHGQNERAIEVIGNFGDNSATPGINKSLFRVKFAEKWFSPTDTLRADDGTMVRVQEEPYQDGAGFVYTLILDNGDNASFIDPAQITAGARFSKMYSKVEEFSIKGGGTNFATPFKMRNQLTTLRKHHAVTRSAATDVLIMELPSPNDPNKTTKYWFRLAEWTFMAQWAKEKDFNYIYGTFSEDATVGNVIPGQNGRPVRSGAGLREQIAPANIRYYNQLTYKILDDMLLDLSYNANANGGNHKFVALTGKMGMRAFSDAVSDKLKSLGVTIVNEGRFISGTGNELVFTGDQWRTANFPNGVSLTVRELPLYDDLITHRTLHPESLRPLESYRFTIFNIGSDKNGQANVRKVVKRDSEDLMWNVAGSISPYANPAKSFGTERSSGIDGFEIHALSEEGIILADPTSAAELIMDVQ